MIIVMKSKSANTRPPAPTTNALPIGPAEPSPDEGQSITRQPTVRMGIELAVPVGNTPGLLKKVLGVVSAGQANILAYCTLFDRDRFAILLVADAAWDAKTALADAGFACTAHAVVLVSIEDRTGATETLFNQLSGAQIAVRYGYVAALTPPVLCAVFSTDDDRRAIRVLTAS